MTAPKNPRPIGLPISISVEEAFANLERSRQMDAQRAARRAGSKVVIVNALKPTGATVVEHPSSDRSPTRAERHAQQVRESYLVGDTTPSKVDLSIKDLPGPMLLEVSDIDVYDHNPRIFPNEKIEDLEASLRVNGYHDAMVVTRRREGDRYMLAAGSNTTLRVLQELWRSTQDDKYRYVNCIFQPYQDEARLLVQHLGENLNRGDMRFWEVAKGMVDLLDQIERDAQTAGSVRKPMGLREQSEALAARGLRASKTLVSMWRFAVAYLGPLGDGLRLLTLSAVKNDIQPRTMALRALAAKFTAHKIDDGVFWRDIVAGVLRDAGLAVTASMGTDAQLDVARICDGVEAALAERLGESVSDLRRMLSLLKLSPELSLAALRMPSPNIVVGRSPGASEVVSEQSMSPGPAGTAEPAIQPPLPLGPGQVRGQWANTPSTPSPASAPAPRSAPQIPAAESSRVLSPQQSAIATPSPAEVDPLKALHAAVEQLLTSCGLQDTLRWWDDMPMGFFVDMPDPAIHARCPVTLGGPGHEARIVKSVVWWTLVLMTGQFREGCVPHIDQSSTFFRHFAGESDGNPLHGTDIEQTVPELDEMLAHRIRPGPMRAALQKLRAVEDAAAAMFEACPERWRRMLEVRQP